MQIINTQMLIDEYGLLGRARRGGTAAQSERSAQGFGLLLLLQLLSWTYGKQNFEILQNRRNLI